MPPLIVVDFTIIPGLHHSPASLAIPAALQLVPGNETEGVSAAVRELATASLSVPMAGGVESLNVAVTAALVAYATRLSYLDR